LFLAWRPIQSVALSVSLSAMFVTALVLAQEHAEHGTANKKVEPGSLGSNAGRQDIDESEQGCGLLKYGRPKRKDLNNG
jgi:hypothetical protein